MILVCVTNALSKPVRKVRFQLFDSVFVAKTSHIVCLQYVPTIAAV